MSQAGTHYRSLTAIGALLALLVTFGCGSAGTADVTLNGETPTQPRKAVLTLATSGTAADGSVIGGLGVTVNLPDTVSVPTTNGNPDSGVVTASGGAAGQETLLALFTATTSTLPARLTLIAAGGASGLPVGEFATITVNVIAGNNPAAPDFGVEDVSVVDVSGATMPELNVGMSLALK